MLESSPTAEEGVPAPRYAAGQAVEVRSRCWRFGGDKTWCRGVVTAVGAAREVGRSGVGRAGSVYVQYTNGSALLSRVLEAGSADLRQVDLWEEERRARIAEAQLLRSAQGLLQRSRRTRQLDCSPQPSSGLGQTAVKAEKSMI